MRRSSALVAALLLAPALCRASWVRSNVEDKDVLRALCSDAGAAVVEDEFSTALVLRSSGTEVDVCSAEKPRNGRFSDEYIVKYRSAPGAPSETLAREAEVMPFGVSVRPVGDELRLAFDWPGQKPNRRVREVGIDGAHGGRLTRSCAIERLRSDLAVAELFERVRAHLGDAQSRADFVDGPDAGNERVLDQLFFEAATGNAEALDLLVKAGEGLDAGPAEIVGTYRLYVDQLRARKCRWH